MYYIINEIDIIKEFKTYAEAEAWLGTYGNEDAWIDFDEEITGEL